MSRKRLLAPVAVTAALALAACGSGDSDTTDTTTTRATTPTTAATTSAAAPSVASSFASKGYAFDVPPGSWSEDRSRGYGTDARRAYEEATSGTSILVRRRPIRAGGETSRSAARSLRSTFLKDGASGGRLRNTTLDGERATLLSLASPGPDTRPLTAVVAVHDGQVYTALVVGGDTADTASFGVGAQVLGTWHWT